MSTHHDDHHSSYYVPDYSWWPILAAIGLFLLGLGSVEYFGIEANPRYLIIGSVVILLVLIGWLRAVIKENRAGLYDNQMHETYWWGMLWFLFSDFMLFAGLLGALWYYRIFTLPELAGSSPRMLTHFLLWPEFVSSWPLLVNPDTNQFAGPQQGLLINWKTIITTLVLFSSCLTLYFANLGLRRHRRALVSTGLIATFLLGLIFISLNGDSLLLAITRFGLNMSSGIYGSVVLLSSAIFLLHLLVAAILLAVIIFRNLYGHFTSDKDFSIRAITWFWYFLTLIWLGLFFSVY